VCVVALIVIAGSSYLAVYWNKGGATARPAQSVRSLIAPDERDYASNLYRDQENENLRFTITSSPIIGIGFGKPFAVINNMVDMQSVWPFQLYMPHNNILWLWLRMGLLG